MLKMTVDSLLDRYRHKIIIVPELEQLLGPKQVRRKKVVWCHGVFDVVHPGHVRHLLYAKTLGDILVCSLTADKHISKGPYRPHVPEEMRALNLAAFEIVDYVIIDQNSRPDQNIRVIQPDVYAKGFEYSATARPERTIAEAAIVESYGGKVVYTPGDIVYSSSALLDAHIPDLRYEKLRLLMNRYGITYDTLRAALDLMVGKQVHVVGDTIVDSYTYCTMIGGQTKTPTISAHFNHRKDFVGGAAVVAKHLKAAGADVLFSTVLGNDKLAEFVMDDLNDAGVRVDHHMDNSRPTTNKNAVVIGGYRMLKVDTLDNRSINDRLVDDLCSSINDAQGAAVVFADFRHGIFNKRTVPLLLDSLPTDVIRVADSQVASRWGNILDFTGFDLITPNEREARFALGDQDSGIRPLASQLYDKAQCGTLMLKLGERGMLTCTSADHESPESFMVLDSFADRVVDAVGAGDALLAYATLSLLVLGSPTVGTILGSFAAAVECECEGNEPVSPEQVLRKIDQAQKAEG